MRDVQPHKSPDTQANGEMHDSHADNEASKRTDRRSGMMEWQTRKQTEWQAGKQTERYAEADKHANGAHYYIINIL